MSPHRGKTRLIYIATDGERPGSWTNPTDPRKWGHLGERREFDRDLSTILGRV